MVMFSQLLGASQGTFRAKADMTAANAPFQDDDGGPEPGADWLPSV
jgi:hypothetical protein